MGAAKANPVKLMSCIAVFRSPLGILGIHAGKNMLLGIDYLSNGTRKRGPSDKIAHETVRQLRRYVDDPAWRFSLPQARPFSNESDRRSAPFRLDRR